MNGWSVCVCGREGREGGSVGRRGVDVVALPLGV